MERVFRFVRGELMIEVPCLYELIFLNVCMGQELHDLGFMAVVARFAKEIL